MNCDKCKYRTECNECDHEFTCEEFLDWIANRGKTWEKCGENVGEKHDN